MSCSRETPVGTPRCMPARSSLLALVVRLSPSLFACRPRCSLVALAGRPSQFAPRRFSLAGRPSQFAPRSFPLAPQCPSSPDLKKFTTYCSTAKSILAGILSEFVQMLRRVCFHTSSFCGKFAGWITTSEVMEWQYDFADLWVHPLCQSMKWYVPGRISGTSPDAQFLKAMAFQETTVMKSKNHNIRIIWQ